MPKAARRMRPTPVHQPPACAPVPIPAGDNTSNSPEAKQSATNGNSALALEKIQALIRARELGRRHYAKSDRLLEELIKLIPVGAEFAIPLPGGKRAFIKDNFAGSNKCFRSHGVSRYELEVKD